MATARREPGRRQSTERGGPKEARGLEAPQTMPKTDRSTARRTDKVKERPEPKQKRDPGQWPVAVDGAALLDEMLEMVERHIVLPPGAGPAIVLWSVFTYCLDASSTSPILAIESPVLRCGKTQLIRLVMRFVRRPVLASNISPSVIFRLIERDQPTLLIDEGDTLLKDNEELRGILNSGHTRDAAYVYRNVSNGKDWDPKQFSTWSAKAIALIREMPHTLQDRSIVIRMQRRKPSESVQTLDLARLDRLQVTFDRLRKQCRRWAHDHLDQLRRSEPEAPDCLHDRARDNWRPLLAIADLVGGVWPERCRKAARRLAKSTDDEDFGIELLRDIRVAAGNDTMVRTSDLLQQLKQMEDRPWRSWKGGAGLDAHHLARLLRPFGIHPAGTLRRGGVTFKGYRVASFEDAFDRYLPSLPDGGFSVTSSQTQ